MQPTGTPDLNQTFDAWFDVTTKILKTKIAKLNIGVSHNLFRSIDYQMHGSGDHVKRGILEYNLYGKFRDMGVGRGVSNGNRKRKEWYSRLFFAQVMRLKEIVQTKYSSKAANFLVSQIEAVKDLKYSAYK